MFSSTVKLLTHILRRLRGVLKFSLFTTPKPSIRLPPQPDFLDRIPQNAWDSHMHIFDLTKYPLSPDTRYVPSQHLLSDAIRFEASVRLRNIVLVQPSSYGLDNSCILDALREIDSGRARAVVTFDPDTVSKETLREWHRLGVRGVRVNLQSVGRKMEIDELASLLQRYANIIRPLDWVLQLYVPIATIQALEKVIPKLGVKVCFDHFGQPDLVGSGEKNLYTSTGNPYHIPGFRSLVNLLEQGNTFVKMSAPYRISQISKEEHIESIARELLRVAGGKRVVFATDWPHTRFEGLDIRPFLKKVIQWCGDDDELIERVFRSNAEELWSIDELK